MIKLERLSADTTSQLQSLHCRSFGADSYQSTDAYLSWLYDDNPFRSSDPHCLVARDEDGSIIGCIHTMLLKAEMDGEPITIHSLQNLMVDAQHRHGTGMLLCKRALKGADVAIFPGVGANLAKAYKAMRYTEIESFWGRKMLKPLGAAVGLVGGKLGYVRSRALVDENDLERAAPEGVRVLARPSKTDLENLAHSISEPVAQSNRLSVSWTAQTLRWRFFLSTGPFHILFNSIDTEEFCIVSIGLRHNVLVGRLVEFNELITRQFHEAIEKTLRNLGIELMIAYTVNASTRGNLQELGYKQTHNGLTSFLVTKPVVGVPFALTGAATDLGLEAICTDYSQAKAIA
jgi:hypothetical protein